MGRRGSAGDGLLGFYTRLLSHPANSVAYVLVEETDGNGFLWFPIIGPNKAIDGILKGFKNLQGF